MFSIPERKADFKLLDWRNFRELGQMKCPVKGLSRDLGKKFRNLCKNKWPGSISKVQEY